MRNLIVNADDCNLTNGVTRAILECHEKGIVSSTTWMVNCPTDSEMVLQVAKSGLGVGVHLNVTSGRPISKSKAISSLVDEQGAFKKKNEYLKESPSLKDLVAEYGEQIECFEKHFGRSPTHLDTHHQMHDEPIFLQALLHVAQQRKLPIRRSRLIREADAVPRGGVSSLTPPRGTASGEVKTTNALLGDLDAHAFWTAENLEECLSALVPGSTEVMCHPGILDAELQRLTSMTAIREKEHELFSSPHLKKILERHKIRLINFSQL